jgi:hypothetical protein
VRSFCSFFSAISRAIKALLYSLAATISRWLREMYRKLRIRITAHELAIRDACLS